MFRFIVDLSRGFDDRGRGGWRDNGKERRSSVGRIDDPSRSFRIVVVICVEIAMLQTIVVIVIVIIVFNHRFFAFFFHVMTAAGRCRHLVSADGTWSNCGG